VEVELAFVVLTILVAGVFAWTNGFHDTANAVATSLSTAALTPRVALLLAAVLNGIGSLLGIGVADTVGRQLIDVPVSHPGVGLVLAGLLAAVTWNLLTWWWGMPSSSSHALIGGLAGAGVAAGIGVDWRTMGEKVLLPMLLSPVIGLLLAWLVMVGLLLGFRHAAHGIAARRFKMAQTVSASAMALSHGLQDGQKSMGVMVLALSAGGHEHTGVPIWVRLFAAGALAAGTAAGGWRIIRTLGRRVVPIDPVTGFAAESAASGVLYVAAGVFHAPISSTHTVTAAIMGAGSTRGLRRIRWVLVSRIAVVWVVTPLVTGSLAALIYWMGAFLIR
jgi:inorganic phosphate transporter, PiT family